MTRQFRPSFSYTVGTDLFMTRVTISGKVAIFCSFRDATLTNSALAPVALVLVPLLRLQNDPAIKAVILRYRTVPSVSKSGQQIDKIGHFVQFVWCNAYVISRTARYIGPNGTYETSELLGGTIAIQNTD